MCHSSKRGWEFGSHGTWARTSHLSASVFLWVFVIFALLVSYPVSLGAKTLFFLLLPSSFSLSHLETFLLPSQPGLFRKGMLPKCIEVTALVFCDRRLSGRVWLRGRPVMFLISDVSDHKGREEDSFCFLVFIFLRKFITNHKDCQQGLVFQTFF